MLPAKHSSASLRGRVQPTRMDEPWGGAELILLDNHNIAELKAAGSATVGLRLKPVAASPGYRQSPPADYISWAR